MPNAEVHYKATRVFVLKIGEVVKDWSRPFEDFDQFYERTKVFRQCGWHNVRIEEGQLMTLLNPELSHV